MRLKILAFSITLLSFASLQAQVFSDKVVGKKNQEAADSIKKTDYPYALPIWGAKAAKLGFKLPYSAGISGQYFAQQSDLIINNLQVGFNNGPMYNVDGIIKFDKAVASAQAFTIRPDVWLFPFLDIYAIFGRSSASTDVGFSVYVPDSTNTPKPVFSAGSTVKFQATTFGFGMTPTIGIGGGFMALDMNVAWTDVPQLKKPAFTFIFGPRFGKTFKFKKPESNITAWVGGFRVKLNSETDGSVNLGDALPLDGLQAKVDNAQAKIGTAQQQVDAWWNALTPPQQNNPVNKAKYNAANQLLGTAGNVFNALDQALGNVSNATVQYSMDKRPADMWNFIVGTQYQLNRHWMFRAEVGFLGSRTQVITGFQYRFGL
jgi:hypothetical protein